MVVAKRLAEYRKSCAQAGICILEVPVLTHRSPMVEGIAMSSNCLKNLLPQREGFLVPRLRFVLLPFDLRPRPDSVERQKTDGSCGQAVWRRSARTSRASLRFSPLPALPRMITWFAKEIRHSRLSFPTISACRQRLGIKALASVTFPFSLQACAKLSSDVRRPLLVPKCR